MGAHHCHPSIGRSSLATSLFEVKGARSGRVRGGPSRARVRASHFYYAQRTRRFQVAAGFTSQRAVFRILPRRLAERPRALRAAGGGPDASRQARGGESVGSPAVAPLHQRREPVSSPRRPGTRIMTGRRTVHRDARRPARAGRVRRAPRSRAASPGGAAPGVLTLPDGSPLTIRLGNPLVRASGGGHRARRPLDRAAARPRADRRHGAARRRHRVRSSARTPLAGWVAGRERGGRDRRQLRRASGGPTASGPLQLRAVDGRRRGRASPRPRGRERAAGSV